MDLNDTKDSQAERTRTTNYEGGEAFEADSPERALYELTANNLVEDTFYREDTEGFREVVATVEEVAKENPEFVLQMAKHARQEMYLRDISQILLTVAAYHEETKEYVADYAPDVIDRADEPATILATWEYLRDADWFEKEDSDTLPKPLKKGIGFAMKQFDAYQLAKYDNDNRQKNLKDVLNMAHPHPGSEKQNELYRRLAYGELDNGTAWKEAWEYGEPTPADEVEPLPTPETWETVISEKGNTKEAWESVINRMGLFARLRNLRNMLEAGVDPELILDAPVFGKDYETGELFTIDSTGMSLENVRESKIYPFRFYTAYKQLEDAGLMTRENSAVAEFLEDAVNVGAEELHDTFGDSVVGVDVSGSMRSSLSDNSVTSYIDIAALFGGVFGSKGAQTYAFATSYEEVNAHLSTPAIEYARKFQQKSWGEATYGDKLMRHLRKQRIETNRVVLLTDGQLYSSNRYGRDDSFRSEWLKYKEEVAPEASIYVLDLSSYGTLLMPEDQPDAYQIGGWSDNVLDFMQAIEDPSEVVGRIEELEPDD